MKTPSKLNQLRVAMLSAFIGLSSSAMAIDTAQISASSMSPECIEYRIVGFCYWLYCDKVGCKIRTSVKVKHYVPDAVVTSYISTGDSPWSETAFIGSPTPGAEGGGEGVTSQSNENNVAKFKNVDVIGHPGTFVFNQFVSSAGFSCAGAGVPFVPYFVSTLDTPGWRYNVPEVAYPESLVPGMREVGSRMSLDLWGNLYPRGGFTHQADDYKGAAIAAQRAGDIVTRYGQPHVYIPLIANSRQGYWPAGALKETDRSTGKWQELTPNTSQSCKVFPDNKLTHDQAEDGAYAWALWRPYSCCKKEGQIFLGSVGS